MPFATWHWISSLKVQHISLSLDTAFSYVFWFGQENGAEVTVPGLCLGQVILGFHLISLAEAKEKTVPGLGDWSKEHKKHTWGRAVSVKYRLD